jgi:hypothetical protein
MSTRQHIAIAFASLLTASAITAPAIAGPSAQHLSAASTHSAAASVHAGASVVKGAAAVAAVPFVAVGVSGMASAAAGSALHEFANEPLRIGHEVIHTEVNKTPTPAQQMGKAGDKS